MNKKENSYFSENEDGIGVLRFGDPTVLDFEKVVMFFYWLWHIKPDNSTGLLEALSIAYKDPGENSISVGDPIRLKMAYELVREYLARDDQGGTDAE